MTSRGKARLATPAPGRPPAAGTLPLGFAVELDARLRRRNGGRVLLGGSPLRLLRLSSLAADLIADGTSLMVRDATTAALARRLLDTGAAHPRPAWQPVTGDVTVVVPVRDRPVPLDRLLAAVRRTGGSLPVVVVDDGSRDAHTVRRICAQHACRVVRHEVARGPAAARNAGLAAAATAYVAFLDSDCVPLAGWLDRLRVHLQDPLVAAAAPRIVALAAATSGLLASYEEAASSLDLGPHEGPVHPHGGVPYVPSAALLVRRTALGDGYDEGMDVAEDVDLVWRLVAAGWRVRYEPAARVAHEHRTSPAAWIRRRAFYGTGAALLASRHGAAVAPVVLSPWSAAAWLALCAGRRAGPAFALAILGSATVRLNSRLVGVHGSRLLAAQLVGRGSVVAGRQLASAVVRHYWPVSLAVGAGSLPARRVIAAIGVLDGAARWWPHRATVSLPVFILLRRLDDLSYGAGLWWGAARARSARALVPKLSHS